MSHPLAEQEAERKAMRGEHRAAVRRHLTFRMKPRPICPRCERRSGYFAGLCGPCSNEVAGPMPRDAATTIVVSRPVVEAARVVAERPSRPARQPLAARMQARREAAYASAD